jgi:hypothetical protein
VGNLPLLLEWEGNLLRQTLDGVASSIISTLNCCSGSSEFIPKSIYHAGRRRENHFSS